MSDPYVVPSTDILALCEDDRNFHPNGNTQNPTFKGTLVLDSTTSVDIELLTKFLQGFKNDVVRVECFWRWLPQSHETIKRGMVIFSKDRALLHALNAIMGHYGVGELFSIELLQLCGIDSHLINKCIKEVHNKDYTTVFTKTDDEWNYRPVRRSL